MDRTDILVTGLIHIISTIGSDLQVLLDFKTYKDHC